MTNPSRTPSQPPHPFAGRAWLDLARFVGEALAAGLLASLVLALATFIVSAQAGAAPAPRDVVLPRDPGLPMLTLVTCWPFDAVNPGTPWRYVVVATAE